MLPHEYYNERNLLLQKLEEELQQAPETSLAPFFSALSEAYGQLSVCALTGDPLIAQDDPTQ